MKAFREMLKTELKLSIRGMDMVIFAICMPVVILIILGMLYGDKPAFDGADYTLLDQSFGAISTIAICAGGVMGLPLLISDYRQKKILKRFQVTPISPVLILVVHVVIYMLYSLVSLLLVTIIAKLFFHYQMQGSIIAFLGCYFLVMMSMFSIGMMVGGIAANMKIASVIASLLYFPMLIFSGATLPYEIMPKGLQNVVNILPLTQGIKMLKAVTLGFSLKEIMFPIISVCLLAVVCIGISIKYFRWE